MRKFSGNGNWLRRGCPALAILLVTAVVSPLGMQADQKKKKGDAKAETEAKIKAIDYSNIVWTNPPAIARIKYTNWYASDKAVRNMQGNKAKKSAWMDRLAGTQSNDEVFKRPFELLQPYGIAIDSKGLVYVADQKVGAIFIFNTDTHDVQLVRNGYEAHFGLINGLAMDDDDRLFVSDGKFHRVLIFDSKREVTGQINEGLVDPVGLAIDKQNRFLYVVDTQQDQVLVFDADTLKLLRRIGTGGKNHFLTTPGDFGAPQCVAVDKDGNVYVTDTLNNRVEIFDAEGK